MINLKVRLKNPIFWAQIILAVLMPILAYAGLTLQDITTWQALGLLIWAAIQNPYVLGLVIVSVWNALNDPTTSGLTDSARAMTYKVPSTEKTKTLKESIINPIITEESELNHDNVDVGKTVVYEPLYGDDKKDSGLFGD